MNNVDVLKVLDENISFENSTINKKTAVTIYGSEAQTKHFNKHDRFVNKNMEAALVKTLEQVYESVELVKVVGKRAKHYKLGAKKSEIEERKDERVSNGDWSIPYTKNMDVIVASVLEQGLEKQVAQTLTAWSYNFGLISKSAYKLMTSRFNDEQMDKMYDVLNKKDLINKGEEQLLIDYTFNLTSINASLAGTLGRMSKLNIIEYFPVYIGVQENGFEFEMTSKELARVIGIEAFLRNKLDVEPFLIKNYPNKTNVRRYFKEKKNMFQSLKRDNGSPMIISYYYKKYAIILKATKKKVAKYLEKYNKLALTAYASDQELFLNTNKVDYKDAVTVFVETKADKKTESVIGYDAKIRNNNNKIPAKMKGRKKPFFEDDMKDFWDFDSKYRELHFQKLYTERIKKLHLEFDYEFNWNL